MPACWALAWRAALSTTASTTKANPIRWLWNQARQVYNRFRGERVDRTVTPDPIVRDRFIARPEWGGFIEESSRALTEGQISIQRWQMDFRQALRRSYIDQYLLARGGRDNMTAADWGRLGGMLREQYGWMDRFAQQMAAGEMSPNQVASRMQMYFNSSRESFERGRAAALGIPRLPAYPGDGSTQCRTNCQCSWDITEAEDEWLAYWRLGVAEHCPDCVRRSQEWAPYRIPR
jgi:hypothetical protein